LFYCEKGKDGAWHEKRKHIVSGVFNRNKITSGGDGVVSANLKFIDKIETKLENGTVSILKLISHEDGSSTLLKNGKFYSGKKISKK